VGLYDPRYKLIETRRVSHVQLMSPAPDTGKKPRPVIECDKLWKAYDEELIKANKLKAQTTVNMTRQPLTPVPPQAPQPLPPTA